MQYGKSDPYHICDRWDHGFVYHLACPGNMHKRKVNDTISSLNKKLNFIARYDALTSLLNRRVFMEDLQYRNQGKRTVWSDHV